MSVEEIKVKIEDLVSRNTAKQPFDIEDRKSVKCGRCQYCEEIVYSGDRFCRCCGQKQDWSKVQ